MAGRDQTAFPFLTSTPRARRARIAGSSKTRGKPARRAEAPRVQTVQEALPLAPPLPDEAARQRLENRIAAHLHGGRLALAVTDNRYTMIAVKRERGLYRVRLHHMFLDAEPPIVRALARYIADNDRRASELLGAYIDRHQYRIRHLFRRPPANVTIETQGEVYDLKEIFDSLNQKYFEGTIRAQITWGNGRGRRKRRHNSIKMGSYSVEDRLIRVHPSLDRTLVPRFFVEWIVYHEMLHQVFDIPMIGGRRQFHTRKFREAEAAFEDYERASRWEKEHLSEILNY